MKHLSDLDLLVEIEITFIDLHSYGAYRDEHKEKAEEFRKKIQELRAEATRRGIMNEFGGWTDLAWRLKPGDDPRVLAKREDVKTYWRARLRGDVHHVSPYGEVYGEKR